jgi:hypothetical protein
MFYVGKIRLERTAPTSLTWCANQLRHFPIPYWGCKNNSLYSNNQKKLPFL